jgi:hypothetical protein
MPDLNGNPLPWETPGKAPDGAVLELSLKDSITADGDVMPDLTKPKTEAEIEAEVEAIKAVKAAEIPIKNIVKKKITIKPNPPLHVLNAMAKKGAESRR